MMEEAKPSQSAQTLETFSFNVSVRGSSVHRHDTHDTCLPLIYPEEVASSTEKLCSLSHGPMMSHDEPWCVWALQLSQASKPRWSWGQYRRSTTMSMSCRQWQWGQWGRGTSRCLGPRQDIFFAHCTSDVGTLGLFAKLEAARLRCTQQSSIGDEVGNVLLVEPSGHVGEHQEHVVATAPIPPSCETLSAAWTREVAKASWSTESAETWQAVHNSTARGQRSIAGRGHWDTAALPLRGAGTRRIAVALGCPAGHGLASKAQCTKAYKSMIVHKLLAS